ncbi:MAG: ATP-binding protein [Candidatus Parabeggiatoa sp. nov. 1]|nr:MAG: ATP-binding protein [Gammaproteobacteria bacterium]
MDNQTLQSLKIALDATPENHELLMVVLRAGFEQEEYAQVYELLKKYNPDDFKGVHRQLVAEICLAADDPELALTFADADSGASLMLKARVYLALDRRPEGYTAYQAAVEKNPALEDPQFKTRLNAKVREFSQGKDRPRLKVISNDDTDDTELTRLLVPGETLTFKEVGGLEHIKKQIHKKIILPFQKPTLFQRFKKRVGGGILLYGPPGCGKTLLARATAGECQATFYNVVISDVLDMYIGESERKLHAVFEQARSNLPAVLFFDEMEALGGKRQYTREGTSSKLVSQFLSEMDGFSQSNQGVLILGATNVPWSIDAAFRRPGRFDRVLFVPPPDREARASILKFLLVDRPVADTINIDYLAKQTSGFSGADLTDLVETSVDEAIEDTLEQGSEVPLTDDHLKRALRQIKPTTLEWLTTARNYAKYSNESGQYNDVLTFLKKHGKG